MLAVGVCWPRRKDLLAWKIAAACVMLALLAIVGRPCRGANRTPAMKTAATSGCPSPYPTTRSSDPTSLRPTAASTAPTGCWCPTPDTSSCGTGPIRTRSWRAGRPPLPYALACATYNTTLEGDEYLLLTGRLTIDVYCRRLRGNSPGIARRGALARAQLDGKPARLRLAGIAARTPSPPSLAPTGGRPLPSPPGYCVYHCIVAAAAIKS